MYISLHITWTVETREPFPYFLNASERPLLSTSSRLLAQKLVKFVTSVSSAGAGLLLSRGYGGQTLRPSRRCAISTTACAGKEDSQGCLSARPRDDREVTPWRILQIVSSANQSNWIPCQTHEYRSRGYRLLQFLRHADRSGLELSLAWHSEKCII